jgi:hypothetical protein
VLAWLPNGALRKDRLATSTLTLLDNVLVRSSEAAVDIDVRSTAAPRLGVETYYRVIFAGIVRPAVSGATNVRCSSSDTARVPCVIFWDGARLDNDGTATVQLTADVDVRLKVEVTHFHYTGSHKVQLQWKAGAAAEFDLIAPDFLSHAVRCDGGCGAGGCCVADNMCACAEGRTGARCEIDMSTACGAGGTAVRTPGVRSVILSAPFSTTSTGAAALRAFTQSALDISLHVDSGDYDPAVTRAMHTHGYLTANLTCWYTLYITADISYKSFSLSAFVDGVPLADVLEPEVDSYYSFKHHFVAGHAVRVDLWLIGLQLSRSAFLVLQWRPPNTSPYVISTRNWTSYAVDAECDCAGGCSGNTGRCLNGVCACGAMFTGAQCEKNQCRSTECFGTDACFQPALGSSALAVCSGRGTCDDGACTCSSNESASLLCATGTTADRVCDAAHHGLDCELDVCGATDARRSGLVAEWFVGDPAYGSDAVDAAQWLRVLRTVVPTVDVRDVNKPAAFADDPFRVAFAGLVRPAVSGVFNVRCGDPGSAVSCFVFWNGTRLEKETSAVVQLTAGVDVRVKVELTVRRYTILDTVHLQWKAEAAAEFDLIAPDFLSHAVRCDGGCGAGGCCVGDNVCACAEGHTGAQCEIDMGDACGTNRTAVRTPGVRSFAYTAAGAEVQSDLLATFDVTTDRQAPFDSMYTRSFLTSDITGWYRIYAAVAYASVSILVDGTPQTRLRKPQTSPFFFDFYFLAGRAVRVDAWLTITNSVLRSSMLLHWRLPNADAQIIRARHWTSYAANDECKCAGGCNGVNGRCVNGVCACDGTAAGAACELPQCRAAECCGTDACFQPALGSSALAECSDRGICSGGEFQCAGDASSALRCAAATTADRVCDSLHYGLDCQYDVCDAQSAVVAGLYTEVFNSADMARAADATLA